MEKCNKQWKCVLRSGNSLEMAAATLFERNTVKGISIVTPICFLTFGWREIDVLKKYPVKIFSGPFFFANVAIIAPVQKTVLQQTHQTT